MKEFEPPGRQGRHEVRDCWLTIREDNPTYATEQDGDVEIDDQRERQPRCLQIRDGLGEVDGGDRLDGFELDDQPSGYQKIESSLPNELFFVAHSDGHLSSESQMPEREFDGQCLLVDTFQEPRPQNTMHFNGRIHHLRGDPVDLRVGLVLLPAGVPGVLAVHSIFIDRARVYDAYIRLFLATWRALRPTAFVHLEDSVSGGSLL